MQLFPSQSAQNQVARNSKCMLVFLYLISSGCVNKQLRANMLTLQYELKNEYFSVVFTSSFRSPEEDKKILLLLLFQGS